MARESGLNPWPKTVAELGPGDSLGIGLAALITGCETYYAFDVVEYAAPDRNLLVFDELVRLFRSRTPVPGEDEFTSVKPCLASYEWPGDLLDDSRLETLLERSRLERIRASIADPHGPDSMILYKVPWADERILCSGSVDMIYSQAVLEHIDDLPGACRAMHRWLKPDGYLSHQIDFKAHGTAVEWNGHWAYSDLTWKLIKGRRPYLLNREPHSTHVSILERAGFSIVCDQTVKSHSNLERRALAHRFRSISDDDLTTSGAFIQAVKRDQN
jgi:hypothetical protein